MVPPGTGKPEKMGDHFPVREFCFAKTAKVRGFYPKYWKNQKKLYWKIGKKYWKNLRNLSGKNPANMVPYWKTAKNIVKVRSQKVGSKPFGSLELLRRNKFNVTTEVIHEFNKCCVLQEDDEWKPPAEDKVFNVVL